MVGQERLLNLRHGKVPLHSYIQHSVLSTRIVAERNLIVVLSFGEVRIKY
jgi:hypothetical protein